MPPGKLGGEGGREGDAFRAFFTCCKNICRVAAGCKEQFLGREEQS